MVDKLEKQINILKVRLLRKRITPADRSRITKQIKKLTREQEIHKLIALIASPKPSIMEFTAGLVQTDFTKLEARIAAAVLTGTGVIDANPNGNVYVLEEENKVFGNFVIGDNEYSPTYRNKEKVKLVGKEIKRIISDGYDCTTSKENGGP